MIVLYYVLLVLLVITIFDSYVGFAFAFAQNNVYRMNFSTRSLDDNKNPMTINVAENAADANTVGFDASDILEGILTIADIAGVAIVGLVIVTVYYQKREKIQALSLAKDSYSMKLALLTNATVVNDAIRFVYHQNQKKKN
jgi:hypothetical protein